MVLLLPLLLFLASPIACAILAAPVVPFVVVVLAAQCVV